MAFARSLSARSLSARRLGFGEQAGSLSSSRCISNGVVWHVRQPKVPLRPTQEEAESIARLAGSSSCVVILAPEDDFGRLDSKDARVKAHDMIGPPAIDQITVYLRQLENAIEDGQTVVHVTSLAGRAAGAVLVGASLVLLRGLSPAEAWTELLRCGPAPSERASEAWDRFPAPCSRSGETTASSLRVVDCLAGLAAARDKGWYEGHRAADVAAWRMLRSKFDASWIIPGELLAVASGEGKKTFRDGRPPAIEATRSGTKDSCGTPSGGSVCGSTRATSCGSASEDDDDDEDEVDSPPPRLQRASPLLRDLPVFRSFCFDIPDERGSWDGESACSDGSDGFRRSTAGDIRNDTSIVQFLERSGVGLFIRLGDHPNNGSKCRADVDLRAARIRVAACQAPGSGDTPAMQAVRRCFLDDCEGHRASPGVAPGVVLNGQFAPDGLGVLLAAYTAERHNMDGATAHGWLRICRPGAVPTPEQERLVRMMRPVAPRPGFTDKLAKFVRKSYTAQI